MTTLAFLLSELSPLLVFELDFLSLLCNTNTLQNILMMLGTNVEQDEMTCCIQVCQLWRDWGVGGTFVCFFSKKPLLVFILGCFMMSFYVIQFLSGALGGLCFMMVALLRYSHIYFLVLDQARRL